MKALIPSLLATALFLTSCASGDPSARADYSERSFDPLRPKIAQRENDIRRANPMATDEEVGAAVAAEFRAARAVQRAEDDTKAAQRAFAAQLAAMSRQP